MGSGWTCESGRKDATGCIGSIDRGVGVCVDVRARLMEQYLGRRYSRTIEVLCYLL